jgi:hypothetical protein
MLFIEKTITTTSNYYSTTTFNSTFNHTWEYPSPTPRVPPPIGSSRSQTTQECSTYRVIAETQWIKRAQKTGQNEWKMGIQKGS